MKKKILLLCYCIGSLYCTAQETKTPGGPNMGDKSMVSVPLKGIKSAGIRGCENCNVSGRLTLNLGVRNFTIKSSADLKYNEKQNTLQLKYLIINVEGKYKAGGVTVSGPYGGGYAHSGGNYVCTQYGFACPPPNNRIGKTKYEIVKEGEQTFLVVTFLEDLKVEKGFFEQ